eukprot:TRINITY_DN63080_c0_g1_i1.p1 TRINITY_DN63080_c0_g1~~TRINITY_DN63080_c0_g1_i1.p1  ORF type:complete len:606 (+),score=129.93 TRINITY_DN63080_c0_g1_i1:64-1881(+)
MAPSADLPWVDRHKPRHLGEVIGNTDQVRKLAEWLRDWDDVVLRGKTKEVKEEPGKEWQKFKAPPENINARAALVSGPPGIGKTTTATLVAKCCQKYKVMEYNASDARSKAVIDGMSKSLAGNTTLRLSKDGKGSIERAIIIMDECDGMAGGGDKGGMTALMNMIKTTRNPIICICNDRGDPQVRNLAQMCLDMKFKRPTNAAVAKRVSAIMEREGKKVNATALESTVEACGQDIRQVMNHMQFFRALGKGTNSGKDTQVMLSPFDACTKLLSTKGGADGKPLSLDKRMDLFYTDADLMSLMVQENYLRSLERGARSGETQDDALMACCRAAENIALADSMSGQWELMGSAGVIGTIYPAFLVASDHPIRATFPAWLQKRGPQGKAERLVQDLHSRLLGATSCSQRSMVTTAYHELLHRRLLQPLTFGDTKTCAAQLSALGLNREFFTEQAPALRVPLGLDDTYRKVEGKHKTQLLQDLQNLQATLTQTSTKRKQRFGDTHAGGGAGDAGDEADAGHDEVGNPFKKKAKKETPKAKAKGKSSGGGSRLATLGSWIPKKEGDTSADANGDAGAKNAGIVLKFIEGFSNAVRRKVQMQELLSPWRDF